MYPHILDEERRYTEPRPDRTVGLRMRVNGKWYFFPGGTPMAAGVLAEYGLGREAIEADSTRVEWGSAASGKWHCEKVLKAPIEEEKIEVVPTEEDKKAAQEEKTAGWG